MDNDFLEARLIGIRAVDYQHAYFLDIYNDLVAQIKAANGGPVALSSFIAEVFAYTDYHFKTEEALMAAVGYPDLPAHRVEHQDFFNRFDELTGRLDEQRATLAELTSMIRAWITEHIDVHDRHFGAYYAALKAQRRDGRS